MTALRSRDQLAKLMARFPRHPCCGSGGGQTFEWANLGVRTFFFACDGAFPVFARRARACRYFEKKKVRAELLITSCVFAVRVPKHFLFGGSNHIAQINSIGYHCCGRSMF